MPAPPEGMTFQIQKSGDGTDWVPLQPGPDGVLTSLDADGYWFTDHHLAWVAANQLRNNTMWVDVRIVHRSPDGSIVREQRID